MQTTPAVVQPSVMLTTQPAIAAPRRRIYARHIIFKVGVGMLLFSAVLFFVSYIAPAWVKYHGLWMACSGDSCFTLRTTVDWFNAVRAMETLAFIILLACICVEFYQDVFKLPPPPDNKVVEILALISMVFHLIGIIVFGARADSLVSTRSNSIIRFWEKKIPMYSTDIWWYERRNIFWAYGLAVAACVFGFLSAFLIAFGRARHTASTTQAMGVQQPCVMTPMQNMLTISGQPGYYQPTPHPYYANGFTTTHMTGQPSAGFQALSPAAPTSSALPVYYIETQGHPIPVYREVPSRGTVAVNSPPAAVTSSPPPTAEPTATGNIAQNQNGKAPDAAN